MDPLSIIRRRYFFRYQAPGKQQRGLEVGPFHRPTVLPHEAEMYFADYYDTRELREQAVSLNIDPALVPETHYILRAKELHLQLENERFDFIIANHVLEHIVDPFRWIKNLEPFLKPGGRFLITLPDKRFSFDKCRPDTSLAHFIEDFLQGGERSIAEHTIEAALYYDYRYVGKENDISARLNSDFLKAERLGYHPGMHVHVFQAASFLNNILKPFLAIGWLDLQLESFDFNDELKEISFTLIKSDGGPCGPPDNFFDPSYDTLPESAVHYKL